MRHFYFAGREPFLSGFDTFEKELNGQLHAHHLVHVEVGNMDVIERWIDGEIINARKAVASDPGYIT